MPTFTFTDADVVSDIPIQTPNIEDIIILEDYITYNLNTNHYGTIEEGDNYFNQQLNSHAWLLSDNSDKLKALVEATRLIDNLAYWGDKLVETQRLQFPRDYQDDVPEDINKATYEISLKLLDGFDIDNVINNMRVTKHKYSSIETDFSDRAGIPENILALIPSVKAWYLIKPYLYDGRALAFRRV